MPARATNTNTDANTDTIRTSDQSLDLLSQANIAAHLFEAQSRALAVLAPVLEDLTKAADMMAGALQGGGALIYGAAGSSGLMAAADALELPGTFGIDPDRIHILMAGGQPTSSRMPGAVEDDAHEATHAASIIGSDDCVIVVTASGSTPYAVALARAAKLAKAKVIAISNTKGAALFEHADLAICLPTPPEPLAGSTRMGAGTSQKVALNIMSTSMAVKLGHVHDGMMVNLKVENDKLRVRATQMVATIAGVSPKTAGGHLKAARYAVKPAVLLACGSANHDQAIALLKQTNGNLRAAMARLSHDRTT